MEPGAFQTNVLQAASTSDGSLSDYDAVRRAAARTLQRSLQRGYDPQKVARLVVRVARARAPQLRYPAGREAHWLPVLKVLMPQRMFDRLLRRGYGLQKADAPGRG